MRNRSEEQERSQAMKNGRSTLNRKERQQQIAMCAKTFFNLEGRMPKPAELASWLDDSWLGEIMNYLGKSFRPEILAA